MILTVHLAYGVVQPDVSSDDSDVNRWRSIEFSMISSHALMSYALYIDYAGRMESGEAVVRILFARLTLLCAWKKFAYLRSLNFSCIIVIVATIVYSRLQSAENKIDGICFFRVPWKELNFFIRKAKEKKRKEKLVLGKVENQEIRTSNFSVQKFDTQTPLST